MLCPTSKEKFGHPATSSVYKLETTSTSKYLDITISSDLSCSTHVKDVAARENWDVPQKSTYTTMVHPRLEYVSDVWCPRRHKDIQLLEKVQHWAARYATNNYADRSPGSVTSMPKDLKWSCLKTMKTTDSPGDALQNQHWPCRHKPSKHLPSLWP